MKPSTIIETLQMITAWRDGTIKKFLAEKHITYYCAMMRISRFRRAYPKEYKAAVKC